MQRGADALLANGCREAGIMQLCRIGSEMSPDGGLLLTVNKARGAIRVYIFTVNK